MAEVFLARSFGVAGFEKRLVIKRIRSEHASDPRFIQAFINEGNIGTQLSHPNIVQVYELGRAEGTYFLAMEHLHGRDLNKVAKRLRADGTTLPIELAVYVVAEVLRGLGHAHGMTGSEGEPLGLIHRDVSPHNVFLTFAGEVKLVDFGIARLMNAPGMADAALPGGGKFAYMAPEQANRTGQDHRTDLYAAGIVLWELIEGHRLFDSTDPDEKLRQVRESDVARLTKDYPKLQAILDRALQADPAARYQSAALFEEDLRAWLFERGTRVAAGTVGGTLRALFPDVEDARPALDLRRLARDIGRIDAPDATASEITHTGTGSQTATPLRVRAARSERKRVAVLVVDVDGFTDLSIRAEPEVLFQRHLQLLRWMRKVVDRHGGVIQRADDDQIYVFFGVPKTRSDDLERAIACAEELHGRIGELRRPALPLALAIGTHLGDVTLGPAASRLRYMSRGDTTRLARRLSEAADHGQTLVSEAVIRAAEAAYLFRRGPSLHRRGGKSALPTFVVDGRRPGRSVGRGRWLRRGEELNLLRERVLELGKGLGSTLAITGGEGLGKSRLVREVAAVAHRRGIPTYFGFAAPFGDELDMLRGIVRGLLDLDPVSAYRAKAHDERLAELGLHGRDLEVIHTLMGGKRRVQLDAGEPWDAVLRMLRGAAAAAPVLLILEDAHHVRSDAMADLARLALGAAEAQVLTLLSSRDTPDSKLESLTLRPLGPDQSADLLANLLDVNTVGDRLRSLVTETCEGTPLYIEELGKYLMHEDKIQFDLGVAELDGKAELPDSIAGLIAARIDTLDPGSKGALQIGATIGQSFPIALLAEVIGLDDPVPLVTDLAARGLLTRAKGKGKWKFASRFVREAALRGILGVQRRDYHRLIADAVERSARNLDDWRESLAEHCGKGGRPLDAARYSFQAAEAAESLFQLQRAESLYRRALHWLEQVSPTPATYLAKMEGEARTRRKIGTVCHLLGRPDHAMRELQLALDVAEEAELSSEEAHIHHALGLLLIEQDKTARASAHLGFARRMAGADDELAISVLEALAELERRQGRSEQAIALWRDAVDRAHSASARSRCLAGLASCLVRNGRFDEAHPVLLEGLEAAKKDGNRLLEGRNLNNLGMIHAFRDDDEKALAYFREALAVREGTGYLRGAAVNHHNIGDIHLRRGDFSRASVAFTRSLELAQQIGWAHGERLNTVYLKAVELRRSPEQAAAFDASLDELATDDPVATLHGRWLLASHWESRAPDHAIATLEKIAAMTTIPSSHPLALASAELLEELSTAQRHNAQTAPPDSPAGATNSGASID